MVTKLNTIYLSDFDMQRLIDGTSTTAVDSEGRHILVTFAEGSRRYVE